LKIRRRGAYHEWLMRRRLVALLIVAASPLLLGDTCGQDIGDKGRGEPCTRDGECREGLLCVGGTCKEPSDAGPPDDGGAPDAGPADGASADSG